MFDVYGDDIVLDGHKVGKLEGAWPTLRQRAVNILRGESDDYVLESEHYEVVSEMQDTIDSLRERIYELEHDA